MRQAFHAVCRLALSTALSIEVCAIASHPVLAGDLNTVPLLNGERADSLNLWGGTLGRGNSISFARQTAVVHSGAGAYQANLGSIPEDGSKFFQTFSSAVSGIPGYRQDRNLTRYETLDGFVRNDTGAPLTFSLELKDYRDSTSHSAVRSYTIPAGGTWTNVVAPLDLATGWTVTGTPDLTRTFAVSFLVNADSGAANGSLYLDDFNLTENGPSIDVATAPIDAHRRAAGPPAIRCPVDGAEQGIGADSQFVGQRGDRGAEHDHRRGLDSARGGSPRLGNAGRRRRLHGPIGHVAQYKPQPDDVPADAIFGFGDGRTRDRPRGIQHRRLVHCARAPQLQVASGDARGAPRVDRRPAKSLRFRRVHDGRGRHARPIFNRPGLFGCCTYSGYTNEHKVIALAAEVSDDSSRAARQPMEQGHGPRARVAGRSAARTTWSIHLEPSIERRSCRRCLNLFVDTSDRGADNYPVRSLARNPWANFVRYEADVAAKLDQLGRDNFVQPDAGAGAGTYQPVEPLQQLRPAESVSALERRAGAHGRRPGTEEALRFLLDNGLGNGLDGPLGLADSAQWATGAANPTSVPSFADNWNMTFSLMALMEFLEGPDRASRFFAEPAGG